MGNEQVPVLRLSPNAADVIRELAASEGLSEGEMVEVAVSAYAALPSERRAAAKAALREAPQLGLDGAAPDRASVARSSDPARARLAAEARTAPRDAVETDDDILVEAIRLTKRQAGETSGASGQQGRVRDGARHWDLPGPQLAGRGTLRGRDGPSGGGSTWPVKAVRAGYTQALVSKLQKEYRVVPLWSGRGRG